MHFAYFFIFLPIVSSSFVSHSIFSSHLNCNYTDHNIYATTVQLPSVMLSISTILFPTRIYNSHICKAFAR